MKSISILGRQPALGIAELESLYGASALSPLGTQAVGIDLDTGQIDFNRLGGSVKLCKVLTILNTNNWGEIERYLIKNTPEHAAMLPEGKLTIGLSLYDISLAQKRLLATGLEIKKAIKKSGRSVRLVPNKEPELNTAQVIHNGLTKELGWELVLITNGRQTIIAQTVNVQDIDAYRRRDQERPARDARVGMLPPKLAQIIINLGIGEHEIDKRMSILDPFCGTGVVLQEALLLGCRAFGTDLEPRMIEYSEKNLNWLPSIAHLRDSTFKLKVADATSHHWFSETSPLSTDSSVIACETYLGRPLSSLPDQETLHKIINDCNTIHRKFLQNVARQTPKSFRMCIAVPAWRTKSGFKHMPVLDSLEEIGYNRLSFVHAGNSDLIYHRPDQVVARELVVLERR